MTKMKILESRKFFKPFDYPWAYDFWEQHEAMHWLPKDVPMSGDVEDWNNKITDGEKSLLTNLFTFFTQADVDVANGYNTRFLPYFAHKPELAMMMDSFAAREAVHIGAYSHLIETVGMPQEIYKEFTDFKEMLDKHEYVSDFGMETHPEALKSLAVYSAFTEGMQLFASFIVLLNFARFNKMKNMKTIIAWSIRDESLHVDAMTTLFREYYNDYVYSTNNISESTRMQTEIVDDVREIAYQMVTLEDNFIDLIFNTAGTIEGLTPDEVKSYIRYIANIRWQQLGFNGVLFESQAKTNPLPWVDEMLSAPEHSNFFEAKSTQYAKAMTKGTMEDVQW